MYVLATRFKGPRLVARTLVDLPSKGEPPFFERGLAELLGEALTSGRRATHSVS